MTFTLAKCYTEGLVAFGVNGSTNHYASRSEIEAALRVAEYNDTGYAPCGGMTVHRDNLKLLLNTLGPA